MLPYGTGISLYAFILLFNLRLLLSILFNIFFYLVLKRQTEMVNGSWYQHLLTLLPFFMSNTEWTNFRIMFVCFMFM